jgi:hypothetical protein
MRGCWIFLTLMIKYFSARKTNQNCDSHAGQSPNLKIQLFCAFGSQSYGFFEWDHQVSNLPGRLSRAPLYLPRELGLNSGGVMYSIIAK